MDLTTETLPWYNRRHHCAGGFQNMDTHQRSASLWKGLTWSAHRIFHDKEHAPPPVRRPDAAVLRRRPTEAEPLRVTWLGHSTMLLQTPGFTLLTDPVFSERASPVPFAGPRRLIPPALTARDLPPVDAVLLSHDHYDHCDQASIEALHRAHEPVFFMPLGVARRLRVWNVGPAVELDWGQRATLRTEGGTLRLTCTPARHFSGRSLFDRNSTLWAGWMIEATAAPRSGAQKNEAPKDGAPKDEAPGARAAVRVYFGGDTGAGPHFEEIADHLHFAEAPPEVALLPIGAFQPRELMAPVHVGPGEALSAFETLGARHFVPIHWGTFDLAEEPVQAPARLLRDLAARRGLSGRVHVPDPGEVLRFARHDATRRATRAAPPSAS